MKRKWWKWALGIFVGLAVLSAIFGESAEEQNDEGTTVTAGQGASVQNAPQETPEPVQLDVSSVGEGGIVRRKRIKLRGSVTPGATVTVGGAAAKVDGARWARSVSLEHGSNRYRVVAVKSGMLDTEREVRIERKFSAAERAARAAKREREKREAAEREAARIASLTKTFSGNGSKNIGTINVTEESVLEWTNSEDPMFRQMLIYDKGFGIHVSSDAASGDTVVEPGRYRSVTVAGGTWTIKLRPR